MRFSLAVILSINMGQGINISGLSINKNLETNINELEKILGVELKLKKEK